MTGWMAQSWQQVWVPGSPKYARLAGQDKVLSLHINGIDAISPEECSQIGLLDSKRSDVHSQLLVVPKHDEIIWQGLHVSTAKCFKST